MVQVEDFVRFVITWPWDSDYDLDSADDPFVTGILHIRVELTTVELEALSPSDRQGCEAFDEDEPKVQSVQCILVGIVDLTNLLGVWRPWVFTHTYIVLTVEKANNGVFYRKGRIRLREARWKASKPTTHIIQLGQEGRHPAKRLRIVHTSYDLIIKDEERQVMPHDTSSMSD
ncbi:hypothetical protein GQ44DRAFT_775609 [Phaeosphaeriaceae sp. PMI808]|nr:hypothetical protein GQ44DRAFT_775609 [Phaeosphaeriaceae sp. PMI808]